MARPEHHDEPIAAVSLDVPINAWGESISAVEFLQRPTAGDLEWLQDLGHTGVKGSLFLIHRLTKIPVPSLRTLDAWDYAKCEDALNRFLARGPVTGSGD